MSVTGIDHIHLNVRSQTLDDDVKFFEKLQFRVIRRDDASKTVEMQLGENGVIMELHGVSAINPNVDHVAFRVRDVEKLTQELKDSGYEFERENNPQRVRLVSNPVLPNRGTAGGNTGAGFIFQLVEDRTVRKEGPCTPINNEV